MDKGQLKNLSDAEVDGLYHMVRREREKRSMKQDDQPTRGVTLYIQGIPFDATDQDISALFQIPIRISKNRLTGRSMGSAFCTVANMEDAKRAIMLFDGYQFKGSALIVNVYHR